MERKSDFWMPRMPSSTILLDNQIVFFVSKRMEAPMRNFLRRVAMFLRQKSHSVYEFLKQNGFFDEMVRGIVKLIFFIIFLYCFKQAVW